MEIQQIRVLLFAFAVSTFAGSADAAFLSFSGNLPSDDPDAVATHSFTVLADSDVTFESFSYAGGTNNSGTLIADGGFDPILNVFDASDNLLFVQDDGRSVADPTTGESYDFLTTENLAAGTYTAAITAFSNFATGPEFSDGFDGFGSFTDSALDGRSTFYAFDVSGSQVVPLPAAAWLFGSGLLGLLGAQRFRKHYRAATG